MSQIINSINFNTAFVNDKQNPLFTLQGPLLNAEAYAVSSFYGVNTFSTIDSRNNIISFIESTSSGNTRTFVIPTGNYTLSTFITALQAGFLSAGTVSYTVVNNTLTNRLTVSNGTVSFRLVKIGSNDAFYESGFEVLSPTFALSQTASSTYDLSGVKCLNISTNSLGYGHNIVIGRNLNIIATIPITVGYLGVISYNPPINYINTQIPEVQTVQFSVYDERMRLLTIDKDYQLSICFSI